VALAVAEAAGHLPRSVRSIVTGNPVRREILAVPKLRTQLAAEAHRQLGLEPGRRTVVVFGGSLGALHLDRSAIGACTLLAHRGDLQVLLITGPEHVDLIGRAVPEGGGLVVRVLGYLERMDLAYAVADLVVARAGATTVAELTVCGLPALLVPYPHATANHQEANARALQRAGGASVLLDDHMTAEVLATRITDLLDHEERLTAMAARSASFGRPDAAAALADVVLESGSARGTVAA